MQEIIQFSGDISNIILIVAVILVCVSVVIKIALIKTIFKLYEKSEEISMQLHNITNLLLMDKNKKQ